MMATGMEQKLRLVPFGRLSHFWMLRVRRYFIELGHVVSMAKEARITH